jgi:hypothetical protein
MRWRVAGGGDASSCLLLLGAELAWALAVAKLDGGNERVVDTEERELSIIEANALSCACQRLSQLPSRVCRWRLLECCVCVCISSTSTLLDSSFLPPPPLRALTTPRVAPSQFCPFLANSSNELRHSISISINVFFFIQTHRDAYDNHRQPSLHLCRHTNTSLELQARP